MAAEPLVPVLYQLNSELHNRVVPVTIADASYTVNLPAGYYYLRITGTQTNAGADGTLLVEKYTNQAQTVQRALYGEDLATAVGIATAFDIEAADTALEFWFTGQLQATNEGARPSPIFIPYGLKVTVNINAITALALTVHALRLPR